MVTLIKRIRTMLKFLGLNQSKKTPKGQELIGNVVDKFSEMIAQLEQGVADCQTERDDTERQVSELQARSNSLTQSMDGGVKLARKLSDLMG
jgi:DNA-binding ferritin-like protein